jgi:hypothetical protein
MWIATEFKKRTKGGATAYRRSGREGSKRDREKAAKPRADTVADTSQGMRRQGPNTFFH